MNILVTGAAGNIGSSLIEALSQKDWVETIVGTDIKEPSRKYPKCKFDIRDVRQSMDDIFKSERIDTVVHTAYVFAPIHDKRLMEDINKNGTRNIIKASAKFGVKQILYTSSTTAYGFHPDNDQPLTENSPLRGNDDFIYSKNKKEIEAIMHDFMAENPGITVTIVRPCIVIGPGFNNFITELLLRKLVVIPANVMSCQFVHSKDLINVMSLLLEKRIPGIFNVSGEGAMTFQEMIRSLGNIPIPLPWSIIYPLNNLAWFLRLRIITKFPSPVLKSAVNPWIASSEKLRKETGYQFKYDTRSAFADFVKSAKK
jgi:UDP-glucose 4-epimerase